jgi:hypothetical protein
MRILVLLILSISVDLAFCQDSMWQRFRVDSNLTVEFKGHVEKGRPMAIDKYSYEEYSARLNGGVYMVMIGTSIEKIEVFDREEYQKSLDDLVAGALKAANEENWKTSIGDVVVDSVPGKTMFYRGKYGGSDAHGRNYYFLVNGLSYTVSAIFFDSISSKQDSADLDHFISSIDFTSKIREMQFATKKEYVAYNFGKMIGMLIVLAIVIIAVVFVVRILTS